ncbi:hypothetical protein HZH68_004226 [Vespula germanica]|uniref:Uncharacterized protein n=1 Tax=Vespula germanica TaxID=30212 RepID=A0A834NH14_VESGE|nr:hypothetical protein HZH68_004226 [Vespula germanica]
MVHGSTGKGNSLSPGPASAGGLSRYVSKLLPFVPAIIRVLQLAESPLPPQPPSPTLAKLYLRPISHLIIRSERHKRRSRRLETLTRVVVNIAVAFIPEGLENEREWKGVTLNEKKRYGLLKQNRFVDGEHPITLARSKWLNLGGSALSTSARAIDLSVPNRLSVFVCSRHEPEREAQCVLLLERVDQASMHARRATDITIPVGSDGGGDGDGSGG